MTRSGETSRGVSGWLFRPIDGASITFFRIAFGCLMLHHVWVEHAGYGGFQHWFVEPPFHFTYYGFGWVRPIPEWAFHAVYAAQALACLGIAVGFLYRLSATVNFFAVTYFFLLEKSLFINHGYLLCLISFLLIGVPAHRMWSVDAWLRPKLRGEFVPAWALFILRFQVGVVYVFGGVAKINADWIHGEPMRGYLADWAGRPVIGGFAHSEALVWFFSGGGLLLDLFVVPALLWRPTRVPAFIAVAVFHLTNAWLFNIALFPWFMLVAATLFFPPDWLRRNRDRNASPEETAPGESNGTRTAITCALVLWIAVQTLVPLRHYLYPGNASWTEEGHHFAWRMMLRHKAVQPRFAWFLVTDEATGRTMTIDPYAYLAAQDAARLFANPAAMQAFAATITEENRKQGVGGVTVRAELRLIQFTIQDRETGKSWHDDIHATLTPWQIDILAVDPDLILQYAHHLAAREARAGHPSVAVHAEVWASLHGRPYQLLADPAVDLAAVRRDLAPKNWVRPLLK